MNDKGGIAVRQGLDTTSALLPERLTTGALVLQLALEGIRLHYRRLTGAGPDEGWVSLRLNDGKELIAPYGDRIKDLPSAAPSAPRKNGPPLTYEPTGEDRWAGWSERNDNAPHWWEDLPSGSDGFSYDGLPSWVRLAASVANNFKSQQPLLPPPVEPLSRLEGVPWPLPPFKKFPKKVLAEVSKQNLPGCFFGLTFPKTSKEMEHDFGAEWLTKALHAAGTLPKDNAVAKLVRVKELPVLGFDAAGGAAMKMFLTVEYEKPDPELHTELFVKYPYLYEEHPSSRAEVSGYNDIDGPEISVALRLQQLFPFRTAKFYFCDICRETTNWILITETIPFSRRGKVENGKIVEKIEYKPYDILPVCGKYQDWLLPEPSEFYMCLLRCCGRLAAWDKLGRFDEFLGPLSPYTPEQYLMGSNRPPVSKKLKENTSLAVGKMIDKGIDFLLNTISRVTPPQVKDITKLAQMKTELMEMSPHLQDTQSFFQMNDSDFQGACHANLQADNAFFWRDEHGLLQNGVLDWGGFGRMPFAGNFLGCLSGAEASLLYAHEEGILQCFVDELCRCGGPKLNLKEVMLRYRLCFIPFVYDACQWIERDILKLTTTDVLKTYTGMLDPEFQAFFRVRCRSTTVINAFEYYIMRNDFKSTFDAFAQGYGKPYMTVYE